MTNFFRSVAKISLSSKGYTKQLHNFVMQILETRGIVRTLSPMRINTPKQKFPAYVIKDNSFYDAPMEADLNEASTVLSIYEELVDKVKELLRSTFLADGSLVIVANDEGIDHYSITLKEVHALPLLGITMSCDGKPYNDLLNHVNHLQAEQDCLTITCGFLPDSPVLKVRFIHFYCGDFHHTKELYELIMKVEFRAIIEPIVKIP